MLTDQHRLEAAIKVSWGGYLKIACVTTDCLFSVPITLIGLIRLLMLRIAEMVFHLSFKSSIDKGLHDLPLKVFDVIEAVHAAGHLLGQFFKIRLGSYCLLSC